eukprot:1349517-Pleurochrysis_carterae.AAC.1
MPFSKNISASQINAGLERRSANTIPLFCLRSCQRSAQFSLSEGSWVLMRHGRMCGSAPPRRGRACFEALAALTSRTPSSESSPASKHV